MAYHFSKTMNLPFEQVVEKTTAALKENGFGVLTDINIKSTLKEKLNVDFRNYRILGACSPGHAYKALTAEGHIGLMLPCNVIVQEHENGKVEVSAVDPVASMQAVKNEELHEVAEEVRSRLQNVMDRL